MRVSWRSNPAAVHRLQRLKLAPWLIVLVIAGHAALLAVVAAVGREPARTTAALALMPAPAALVLVPVQAAPREPALPLAAGAGHEAAAPMLRSDPLQSPRTRQARGGQRQSAALATPNKPAPLQSPSIETLPVDATIAQTDAPLPTRVPPSAHLRFSLQRGAATGEADLSWQVDGEHYALGLRASLPQGREIEQHSQGGFDAAGLAPLRLADRRRGRDIRAANFQREHGKITFSGPGWELPLQAGTQDRLSWLVQLVAIASAAPDGLQPGRQLPMQVVGARGAISDWRFEVRGLQRLQGPQGEADALWLVREPAHPYDIRVEVWLDPARGHWPLRLRQTQVPGGEPLEWILRDDPAAAAAPGT
jgi:Protein of unknown function (DUF3108)